MASTDVIPHNASTRDPEAIPGILPAGLRSKVRPAVYGLATFFVAIAVMMSGTSLDESFSLTTGAISVAALSLAFVRPPKRAGHAAV